MTKLTAKTIQWLKDTLSKHEEASNEELLAYFMQAGAQTWVIDASTTSGTMGYVKKWWPSCSGSELVLTVQEAK